jgi:hypothetical protein
LDVQQVFSWLPADTETVMVANQTFSLPDFRKDDWHRDFPIEAWLRAVVLLPLMLKNGALLEYFQNQRVVFALEGSRRFRFPKSLGWFPYEGCTIVVLADDQGDRADSFFKSSSGGALRVEEVEGQKILVFETIVEGGLWTTFVTFRRPNILLVATNLDYLREVLSRMQGNRGPRALPETLPEWRYVNKDAQLWSLRHYDRSQRDSDPTSPFWDPEKFVKAPLHDEQAIGLTFNYDAANGRAPTITYLSGNPSIAKKPLAVQEGSDIPAVVFRELDARAIEASYGPGRPTDFILGLVLPTLLGHGIAL